MAQSQNTTTDDEPLTLNGVQLTGLEAAREALQHYNKDYNDGEMHVAEGGRCLVIITRSSRFQHFDLFQRSEHIRISNVSSLVKNEYNRLKVELKEADR